MDTQDLKKRMKKTKTTQWLIVGGVVLLCVASFYGGTAYQKSKTPVQSTKTASTNPFSRFGGYGGSSSSGSGSTGSSGGARMFRGGSQVTAVSSSSITVQSFEGTSQTYNITSSTLVVKDQQQSAVSDIAVGDRVSIIPLSSDSSTAWIITDNGDYSTGSGGAIPQGAQLN